MSKLLVALIAASFATVAGAQAGATAKEKQSTVKSVTESQAKETTGAATAEGAAKAKAMKGTAKALPDKAAKQAAVKSTTAAAVAADNPTGSPKVDKSLPKAVKPNLRDPAVQKEEAKKATQ
ncbi:hypothetical protein BURK1_02701 [Burkholderiales bacterium]|nr:hypothetical protein BURK1_02701 [Burkholderiales bacterium]